MSHVWLNSAYQTQSYLSNSVQISKILIPSIPENYSLPLPPHSRYDITLKLIDKTWQWCYYDNSCTPTTGTSFNTLSNSITLFSLSFNTSSMSLVSIHDILPTSLLNSSQSIYTPSDFESRRLQKPSTLWPSVSELIIQNKRTILVFANTSYIPLKSDALYIFNGSFIPSVNSIPLLSQDLISTFSSRQILTPQICSRITNSQTISQSSNNTNFPAVLVTQPIQNQTFENLVGCGYSPVASSRVLPVVWTWDTDQPQNTSTLNCVVIQSNNRFRNVDCSSNYKYACKDRLDHEIEYLFF